MFQSNDRRTRIQFDAKSTFDFFLELHFKGFAQLYSNYIFLSTFPTGLVRQISCTFSAFFVKCWDLLEEGSIWCCCIRSPLFTLIHGQEWCLLRAFFFAMGKRILNLEKLLLQMPFIMLLLDLHKVWPGVVHLYLLVQNKITSSAEKQSKMVLCGARSLTGWSLLSFPTQRVLWFCEKFL